MCEDAIKRSTDDGSAALFNKSTNMAVSGASRTTSQQLARFLNVMNAARSAS